jgi:hypothetical protein
MALSPPGGAGMLATSSGGAEMGLLSDTLGAVSAAVSSQVSHGRAAEVTVDPSRCGARISLRFLNGLSFVGKVSGAEISIGRNATIAICLPIANSCHLGLIQAVLKVLKSLASLFEFENRSMHHGGKLWQALHEVDNYLRSQSARLVNYAERYRAGMRVGTSVTEGTANFLVNRRMNKAQQMRWSRRGADLLLQVRCAVYKGVLGSGFGRLFEPVPVPRPELAMAA